MKTPRFWYLRPDGDYSPLLPVLLSPLSGLFQLGTFLRRAFASHSRARVPLICVGNVVTGGAGKTPTAIALARLFKEEGYKPVFVTRGYGGKFTSGGNVVYVDPAQHTAADVGDEALLLAGVAPTWASRDRVAAIGQAQSYGTIIIMDDGFQNPHIAPSASLLVIDAETGIGNGHVVPAGPLRESFAAALARAKAMIIIGGEDRQKLAARAKIPVFRAHLQPEIPPGFPREGRFVAFAGIGWPEKFYATLRDMGLDVAETCDFPDHHVFDQADIDGLRLRAEEQGAYLLTTEKDATRLPPAFRAEVVVLPVSLVFDGPDAANSIMRLCVASK